MIEEEIFAELVALAEGPPEWWGSPLHDAEFWGVDSEFRDGKYDLKIRISSVPATNMPGIVGDLVFEGVIEANLDWRMDEIHVDEYFEEAEGIRTILWDNETGAKCVILAKKVNFRVLTTHGYPGREEFFFNKRDYRLATIDKGGQISHRIDGGDLVDVGVVPDSDRSVAWADWEKLHRE